ncbi:LysR family transcriptional regulator substrate-binding protein [Actinokineospora soli]|uniref:LysR family transcriptional regulator substrate-binding protein n=1 Tax=Actinokineospora soli TaxID=1048753 RepID=A0ABW2TNM0_9PSEU
MARPPRPPPPSPLNAIPIPALRDEVWTASHTGTGHHAMIIGTCRAHGPFDPDLRHHSNDADVLLELVRRAGAVTLLPALTLPQHDDPDLAIRPIANTP